MVLVKLSKLLFLRFFLIFGNLFCLENLSIDVTSVFAQIFKNIVCPSDFLFINNCFQVDPVRMDIQIPHKTSVVKNYIR